MFPCVFFLLAQRWSTARSSRLCGTCGGVKGCWVNHLTHTTHRVHNSSHGKRARTRPCYVQHDNSPTHREHASSHDKRGPYHATSSTTSLPTLIGSMIQGCMIQGRAREAIPLIPLAAGVCHGKTARTRPSYLKYDTTSPHS